MRNMTTLFVLVGLCIFTSTLFADVKLPAIVGDHMVLQQKENVNIWGWADPGEKVKVKASWQWFLGKSTKADKDGKWKVSIITPRAGGPYEISIKGNNTIKLEDVLIGEVWIGSGQSNMEMPLMPVSNAYTGIKDFEKEIANANYPDIRLFQVGNYSSKEPLDDVQPGITMYGIPPAPCKWQTCSPETIPTFSSTSYFFARHLHQKLGVPIGIIDSSWGGTSAEAWTPAAGLKKLEYYEQLEKAASSPQKDDEKVPTRLYNGMIHPLRNFRIKGAIWYQGEGNAGRADKYCSLFSTMIEQWREVFGYEFPFYFVQISPFNYGNLNSAYLREAQLKTMLSVPKTGMAVTMDIGNLTDIHPKNKQEVGRRLALWALANDYGQNDGAYSGPIYEAMEIKDGKIHIVFDYGASLTAKGGQFNDFMIAGKDKKFVPAKVEIKTHSQSFGKSLVTADYLVVWSDEIKEPVAVRYGWSNWVDGSLFNGAGLPASSFRTDDWPME